MTTQTEFGQVAEPQVSRGTTERCSYCWKGFGPDYVPSRKNIHYIFRVRTKYATYYGPTHGGCVDVLKSRQIPGTKETN